MGKTLTRDQRKNSKFLRRDDERRRKEGQYSAEPKVRKAPPKPKWRPHSEIDPD